MTALWSADNDAKMSLSESPEPVNISLYGKKGTWRGEEVGSKEIRLNLCVILKVLVKGRQRRPDPVQRTRLWTRGAEAESPVSPGPSRMTGWATSPQRLWIGGCISVCYAPLGGSGVLLPAPEPRILLGSSP